MFHVELLNRNKARVDAPVGFEVLRFAVDAIGGPSTASLRAMGTRTGLAQLRSMLGYYIRIRNANNTPVWWGMIDTVTVELGGLAVGVSLREFRNRIKVSYTVRDGDGYAVPVATDWDQHDQSVAIYGARELLYAAGELSQDEAEALLARELDTRGLPRQAIDLAQPNNSASITCVGLWSTLAWTYYSNTAGREAFDVGGNAEQAIGWGFTASDVGFADRRLHKISGGLDGAVPTETIRITGSASNNGAFTVETGAEGEVTSYTSTGIAFDPTDDILDSNDGLGFVREGTFVEVSGSDSYDGYHLVDGRGRNHITVDTDVTGTIGTEAAGDPITIDQGQSVPFTAEVTTEIPGNSVSVNGYTKLAYSFTPTADVDDWTAAELWIRARKVGSPGDSMLVALCADASGSPGSILDFATVAGSALLSTSTWVKLELANTDNLAYGTTYWIQVYRTGSNSVDGYYAIGVDEDLQRGAGTLKVFDGSAWVDRPVDADLPFQIWGASDTTDQMAVILTNNAQFLDGYDIRSASAIPARQYRAGDNDALYEIEKLLDQGSGGVALMATVNQDWRAVIDTVPTDSTDIKIILRGGALYTPQGRPLEPGLLPVGIWCGLDGIGDDAAGLAPLSPFLLSYLEYDAQKQALVDLRAWGTDSIFDLGVGQG